MAEVKLVRLNKRFGDVHAVRDIELHVRDGEFVCLLGPSGCGKTTTLRMVAGFETAESGTIWIGGRDVTYAPPYRRDAGMVFQSYALFPHMTVAQNVAFGLRMHRVADKTARQRIADVLSLVGLADKTGRYPSELSGGEQQRVALARVLAIRPSVILMDEPLSNLDAKLRKEMRLEIRRLQREAKTTTIYVTHDQEEAMAIADRIVVMRGGYIEQIGTPDEVYDQPRTRFAAEFIGGSNVLEITVDRVEPPYALGVHNEHLCIQAHLAPGVPKESVTIGGKYTVAIKPEHIRLSDSGQAQEAEVNICPVNVQSVARIGPLVHTVVSLTDTGELLNIYTPSQQVSERYLPGSIAVAQWEARDCVLITD